MGLWFGCESLGLDLAHLFAGALAGVLKLVGVHHIDTRRFSQGSFQTNQRIFSSCCYSLGPGEHDLRETYQSGQVRCS